MSDRRDDGEIRERMVAVETQLKELPRVRERVHELVNCTQQLLAASEDAADARKLIQKELHDLADKASESALASARTETQLGATMAAHIEQCKTDKAEIKHLVSTQLDKQEKMHAENKASIAKLEVRLALYLGVALAAMWMVSHADFFGKLIR